MEVVKVSEILDLVKKIHKDAQMVIHFLEGRTLVGEINRPEILAEKKVRKKRIPRIVEDFFSPPCGEKNPFYDKPKKERKKKEAIVPTEE